MSSLDTSGAIAERLLKLAISLVLLVIILGPVLAISLHIGGPRLTDYVSRHVLGALYKSGDASGITAGPDYFALQDLEDKLTSLTAYRGEAKGAAQALQILIVRHDRPPPSDASASAFRPLQLDLSRAGQTATVVIADQPLRISIAGDGASRRAMLGVEGVSPFNVEGAQQGLLSGFRIAAFGAGSVARPEQLIDGRDAHAFCGAVKRWRAFYGLSQGSVRVDAATNPTRVAVTDAGVVDDGDVQVDLPALGTFCRSY